MHNLKIIRKNLEIFKKKIQHRNTKVDFENLLDLDKKNRELIQTKEALEQEKKIISKTKNEKNFIKSKTLSEKIETLSIKQNTHQLELNKILSNIPNIALEDVPIGKDETANKIIKNEGKINNFSFDPKSHVELGEKNDQLDLKTSTKLSGSRFSVLRDKFALLERGLINFMIDTHVNKFKYLPNTPLRFVNQRGKSQTKFIYIFFGFFLISMIILLNISRKTLDRSLSGFLSNSLYNNFCGSPTKSPKTK